MKYSLIFLISFQFYTFLLIGQNQSNNWLIGDNPLPIYIDTTAGNTCFDFNYDPVKIFYDSIHVLNMAGGNATISDKDGNLLAFSNGHVIMNADNEFIEDTINYSFDLPSLNCNEWDAVSVDLGDTVITGGLLGTQRIIFLPVEERYYAFYMGFSYCDYKNYKVLYSEFTIDSLNPKGKMIKKDVPVLYGDFCDMLHAVRHGNGRDWWVVFFSRGHKSIYTALLTKNGIEEINEMSTGITNRETSVGQICFSPDGTKIAFYIAAKATETGEGVAMMDFDRCDGSASDLRYKILPGYYLYGEGVAFSNDNQFLYAANGKFIRQYDTKANEFEESEQIIAEMDGFGYYYPPFDLSYPVNFNQLNLASDGKIYIFPATVIQRYLSVIDYPYEDHTKVKVRQHSIYVKEFTRTGPNLADFRLGPMDGSPQGRTVLKTKNTNNLYM